MLKSIVLGAAIFMAAAIPTYSATSMPSSTCDDPSMKTMQAKIDAMPDTAQKKTAMDEMSMAKTSVKADKIKDCSLHMDNAMKAVGNNP